jgi:hypothetical protein
MRSRAVMMARRAFEHFDISRCRLSITAPARRARLMDDAGINVLVDVGAHVEAYAVEARRLGYRGRIESILTMHVAGNDDGPPWMAMIEYGDLGFEPIWLDPAFYDTRTGRLLQVDAMFAKS